MGAIPSPEGGGLADLWPARHNAFTCAQLRQAQAAPYLADVPGGSKSMSRTLIIIGLLVLAAGLLWPLLHKLGLGRLPGDFVIRREGFTLYAPIATCILISIVLSVIFWFLRR